MAEAFKVDAKDYDGPVLVTGAGGCIGSWALKLLTDAGVPAVAFDLTEDKRRPNLLLSPEALDTVTWRTGDIGDTETVAAVVRDEGIRAIVHLAALQVPFCIADPVAGAKVNVVGTVNVMEAARHAGLKRVAYASSVGIHGMGPEEHFLATLYGAYKLCDEMIAKVYLQDWKVPSVGIRPGVVYGVGRDQGMTSKTTVAILAAAAGKPYTVPFCGAVPYVHAGEAAAAFLKAVSKERDDAPVFDLNGIPSTVEAKLAIIEGLVPDAKVTCTGSPLPFPADLSDDPIRSYLGDYGTVSLEDGVKETLARFRALLADGKVSADGIA